MDGFIKEYCADFQFNFIEQVSSTIADISTNIDVYEAKKTINNIIYHREKAVVTLTKDDLIYKCEFFEEHDYSHSFFEVKLNGRSYILFRKALYGFTLLDSETLCEFYNYVPQAIQKNEESFIIADVKQFGKLLVFDGCYWAYPYESFAYDFDKKLFINVSDYLGIEDNYKTIIKDNKLVLTGKDKNDNQLVKEITEEEIADLIKKNGYPEI